MEPAGENEGKKKKKKEKEKPPRYHTRPPCEARKEGRLFPRAARVNARPALILKKEDGYYSVHESRVPVPHALEREQNNRYLTREKESICQGIIQ